MEKLLAEWEGLESRRAECTGWKNYTDIELPVSHLVLYATSGRSFNVDLGNSARKFVGKKGHFDYLPIGRYNVWSGPLPMQALVVQIPEAFENAILAEGRWGPLGGPRFQFSDGRLKSLVESLSEAERDGLAPIDAVMLSVAVVDRLYEFANLGPSKASALTFSTTVKRLIAEYIDSHIGAAIAVDRVAFLTGLARTQFGKMFRESFGVPLHKYVVARRVEIATERLLSGGQVTDLAHELGFSSHAHFATVFRGHTGRTPSEFRRDRAPASKTPQR